MKMLPVWMAYSVGVLQFVIIDRLEAGWAVVLVSILAGSCVSLLEYFSEGRLKI